MALPLVGDDVMAQWVEINPVESQELLWLIDQGIVFEVKPPQSSNQLSLDEENQKKLLTNTFEKSFLNLLGDDATLETPPEKIKGILLQKVQDPTLNDTERLKVLGGFLLVGQDISRLFACFLRSKGVKAYPVLPFSMRTPREPSQSDVIEIVFKNLPTPSEETPWERILEYRADTESRAKFLDLRNWINEIAQQKLPAVEVAEKLEYLLSQFERHLNLHKMKANIGVIESVIVTSAEIAENLVKLKFSELAKLPFSIRRRKIALLEDELTGPGTEVAYILKTQQAFSR